MQDLEQINDAPVDAPETNHAECGETGAADGDTVSNNESHVGAGDASHDADGPSSAEDEFDDVLIAEAVTELTPDEDPHTTLKAIIEAAIYITDEPLTPEQIAGAVEQPVATVKQILAQLIEEYAQPSHGLTLRELAGGYKMGTKPEHHESIRRFVRKLQAPLKLSLAALETLAVVAYKQPITAPEIMDIRGVQGAGVLKTLLDRKLVATAGRKDVIGKPIMYKTTKEFLIQFGLSSLNELPTLKEFEELGRLSLTDETPTAVQERSGPAEEAGATNENSSAEQPDDSEGEPVTEQAESEHHIEPALDSEASEPAPHERSQTEGEAGEACLAPTMDHESDLGAAHARPDSEAEESEDNPEQTEPHA
jgi:segregation and condensation protein B